MTSITIILTIILTMVSTIFVVDAAMSIMRFVKLDKKTLVASDIDEMIGTLAEIMTIMFFILAIVSKI